MQKSLLLVAVVMLLGLAMPVQALVLPPGLSYVPPTSGSLVLDEEYGSDHDGSGSWTGTGITVEADCWHIYTHTSTSDYAELPNLIQLLYGGYDWCIDIGIKSWDTPSPSWAGAQQWIWQNTFGNKYQSMFRPDGTFQGLPMAESAPHVLRFSGKVSTNFYTDDNTDSGSVSNIYNGSSDTLTIASYGNQSYANMRVAWMKVYTGVEMDVPPLVPEPATLTLLGLSGLALLRRRRR